MQAIYWHVMTAHFTGQISSHFKLAVTQITFSLVFMLCLFICSCASAGSTVGGNVFSCLSPMLWFRCTGASKLPIVCFSCHGLPSHSCPVLPGKGSRFPILDKWLWPLNEP